ncbi:type II toxin-antitoxin system PemK/MazF family toxin [Acidiferrobacter sp. SPIII_3]|uniref:type II toxin-antitoxin system PemK/MazF family toxin n=1 Tax=Acidiferrobacter sp. SPIII_3 TaxID=1281578 RepID=UPI001F0C6F75|nr:type II toxin-antitoxin system PemK/MazF family toxin [Acidiferrobacter sp. SPIII_3]
MGLRRGDIVTVAAPGDFGKPRPALVVQADAFSGHPTVTVCLLTSALRGAPLFRLDIAPASENGLRVPSQIQIDKLLTIIPRQGGAAHWASGRPQPAARGQRLGTVAGAVE